VSVRRGARSEIRSQRSVLHGSYETGRDERRRHQISGSTTASAEVNDHSDLTGGDHRDERRMVPLHDYFTAAPELDVDVR